MKALIWPPHPQTLHRLWWGTISLMRWEAEEETAAATGRAVLCVTSYRKPPHILARGDKVDPKTLVVNKRQLITSQPGDKTPPLPPPPPLLLLHRLQSYRPHSTTFPHLDPPSLVFTNSQRFRWDTILKGFMLNLQWQVLCRVRSV